MTAVIYTTALLVVLALCALAREAVQAWHDITAERLTQQGSRPYDWEQEGSAVKHAYVLTTARNIRADPDGYRAMVASVMSHDLTKVASDHTGLLLMLAVPVADAEEALKVRNVISSLPEVR